MRRTAWLFLGLLIATPSFSWDGNDEQNVSVAPEDAMDVSIRGGCGGGNCFLGAPLPERCKEQGCRRCTKVEGEERYGVCIK